VFARLAIGDWPVFHKSAINRVHPAGASLSEFPACPHDDKPVLKPETSVFCMTV
jgi:hypothetical protein